MLLFSNSAIVTYVCFGCGFTERKHALNEKKFKTFVKTNVDISTLQCLKCSSELNLFRNSHGEQYWINQNA